jgi:hypothetical protein
VNDGLGLQVWYVAAGVACTVIGLAAFFVPAIAHIEDYRRAQVAAAPSAQAHSQAI